MNTTGVAVVAFACSTCARSASVMVEAAVVVVIGSTPSSVIAGCWRRSVPATGRLQRAMRRPSSGSNRGLSQQGEPTGLLRSGRRAKRTERRAKLLGEDLRLLPGGEVPTPSGL